MLCTKAFKLFGSKLAAAAGSASKGTSSAARRAGDTCSGTGYCAAASSETGFALSVLGWRDFTVSSRGFLS